MEKTLTTTIEDFGGSVASIWHNLHPTTRGLVERALLTAATISVATAPGNASNHTSTTNVASRANVPYDARAEAELSRLLTALDARAAEVGVNLTLEQQIELRRMAETCIDVLQAEAQSAEVFAQLLERAFKSQDYSRVDLLADTITVRLAPSEQCELARAESVFVRAVAMESLAQAPTQILVELLNDPVDAEVARAALRTQADEYELEEARWVVGTLDQMSIEDDL